MPLVEEYCGMFRQVQSLTFDLGPYLFYLSDYNPSKDSKPQAGKSEPSKLLQAFIDDHAQQEDPMRKVRIALNHLKLAMLLNNVHNRDELVQQLQNEYFDAILMDGKPEKGERKLADDYILMINELLDEDSDQVNTNALYRIAIMEFAMELSPYNFDI